jgi:hypothetical protein
LKHGLRDLLLVTLNDKATAWSAPSEVLARVLSTLRRNVALVENPEADENVTYAYGEILGIDLTQPAEHPELLVATTTLWVMCGRDTSFYLFRKVAGDWQLAVEQEANDYADVSGAQRSFQYAVSPPDAAGGFFVVTTNINPWCSSTWQSLRYRAFRVGATPHQPNILLQRKESIFLGDEDDRVITIQPENFRIEFEAQQRIDAAVLVRKHIVAYAVTGDQVSRVPPLAAEPEGFLDEWIDLPWEEAARWSDLSAPPELREWQEWLHAERAAKDSPFFHSFAFSPPACEVEQGRWQVGIDFRPDPEGAALPAGMPGEIYFMVALKEGAYVLESVSASSVPQCTPPQTDDNEWSTRRGM